MNDEQLKAYKEKRGTEILHQKEAALALGATRWQTTTEDVYVSALIELGLVLFGITIVINALGIVNKSIVGHLEVCAKK